MSFNDASVIDAIKTALNDNADYEETGSVSKAKAFITAVRRALAIFPESSGQRDGHVAFNHETLNKQLVAAQQFVAANDTSSTRPGGPAVTRGNFEDFRF